MRFSDAFGIRRTAEDRWFDPVLSIDTPLFLDPLLLYAYEDGCFAGSHTEIIGFFNSAFRRVAQRPLRGPC